ncbi:MAG TPA: hypothetical protein VE963_17120 [Reyranella sp.]|nr:hypothetical protein [Reyranella sp.]
MRLNPFAVGHVLGAVAIGAAIGSFEDWKAVALCVVIMGGNAIVSTLICWRWPGLGAPWWRLWPMATFVNPLMVAGIAWSLDQWECLTRVRTGWDCMLAFLGPLAIEACVPPPLIGLAARWWRARRIA